MTSTIATVKTEETEDVLYAVAGELLTDLITCEIVNQCSNTSDFCLIPIGTGQASVAEYIAKV